MGAVLAVPVILLEGHAVGLRLADAVPSFALVQAWVPSPAVYFGGNGVLWSLSVEVLFYALFPCVIPLARRLGSRAALVAAVGLIAVEVVWQGGCYTLLGHGTVSTWARLVLPVAHLPEFALGVVLALLVQRGRLGRVRLVWAAPLALAAYVASGWAVNDPLVLAPLALLIVGAANSDLARRPSVLRARPLVLLGEWSYCFYLLHQLVIRTVAALGEHVGAPALGWASWTVALAASVLLALALYRTVERPFARRVRNRAEAPAVVD